MMFACSILSHASGITGTVTNLTRQQLSGGDDIILLKLTEGLPEVAHAKTDSRGRFILEMPDDGAKHLIRAVHQGVYYHHPIPKNAGPVEIRVYDVTESVEGRTGRSDVVKVQAAPGR